MYSACAVHLARIQCAGAILYRVLAVALALPIGFGALARTGERVSNNMIFEDG